MSALVLYAPALHLEYLNFFKKYPDRTIYLLDLSLVRTIPRLERDIRAIGAEEMRQALSGLLPNPIQVLAEEHIRTVSGDIVMPDEDVSRIVAETYFGNSNVVFIKTFLRWDRPYAHLQKKVEELSHRVSSDPADIEMMNIAYRESEQSPDWWRQVGAVIARDGKVLEQGHNTLLLDSHAHNTMGDPRSNFDAGERIDLSLFLHAETGCIARAARDGVSLKGAYVYVTTFPCPNCAKSIVEAGITKVFYSEGYSMLDAEELCKSRDVELVRVVGAIQPMRVKSGS